MRTFIIFLLLTTTIRANAQMRGGEIIRETNRKTIIGKKTKETKGKRTNNRPNNKASEKATTYIHPVLINNLSTYNVVVGTYGVLEKANMSYHYWKDLGFNPQIYLDSKNYFRVIIGNFYDEEKALNLRQLLRENYNQSDAWILYVLNGHEERYFH